MKWGGLFCCLDKILEWRGIEGWLGNKRIPQNKQSACHSERKNRVRFCSRTSAVERSEQAEARCVAPQGYGSKSRWLSKGDVTFSVTSHPNSLPYPFVAFAPRFLFGSSPAAHSLAKTSTSVGGRTRRPSLRMTYRGYVWL